MSDGPRKTRKVFCIGLQKTGTKTLKIALRRLGHRHLKRSNALAAMWWRGDVAGLVDAMQDYDSAEDWPWPLCWREMLAAYPDARFILTRRESAQVWLDSLTRWSLRTDPGQNGRRRIYGYDYPHGAEAEHIAFYERHLEEVRAGFIARPGQLLDLCFEAGDGLPELCAFLGEPLPRRPLAHANDSRRNAVDPDRIARNTALAEEQRARLIAEKQKKAGHEARQSPTGRYQDLREP